MIHNIPIVNVAAKDYDVLPTCLKWYKTKTNIPIVSIDERSSPQMRTYSALLNNVKNIALAAEFGFGAFIMPGYDYLPACEGTKEHKDNSRFSGIRGRFRI